VTIIYRQALERDFDAILSIQRQNLFGNLADGERAQGFLSVEYRADQLEEINRGLGIFVALDADRVLGYAIAETPQFAQQVPLLAHMIGRFPALAFDGRPLPALRNLIYGPVCVDRAARGRGILGGLLGEMSRTLADRYDAGIAFISQVNPHSYHAHVDKLGMRVIDEFDFDTRRFWTVAFSLQALARL
jgi:GNAT superfamily N-acetyltransferase